MHLVRIFWHDAHTEHGWVTAGDTSGGPRVIVSVGWLLAGEKAGHHTIAQSHDPEADTWGELLHIPSGMVHHVDFIAQDVNM